MNWKLHLFLLAVVFAVFSSCSLFYPDEAEEYLESLNSAVSVKLYVDLDEGNDSGTGDSIYPFKTIKRAIDELQKEEYTEAVIYVASSDGDDYKQDVKILNLSNIAIDGSYTRGELKWGSNPDRLTHLKGVVEISNSHNVSISNFLFDKDDSSRGVVLFNSDGVRFVNVNIENSGGVEVFESSVRFKKSKFNNNSGQEVFKVVGSRVVLLGSSFSNNNTSTSLLTVYSNELLLIASLLEDVDSSVARIKDSGKMLMFSSVMTCKEGEVNAGVNISNNATFVAVNCYLSNVTVIAHGSSNKVKFYNTIIDQRGASVNAYDGSLGVLYALYNYFNSTNFYEDSSTNFSLSNAVNLSGVDCKYQDNSNYTNYHDLNINPASNFVIDFSNSVLINSGKDVRDVLSGFGLKDSDFVDIELKPRPVGTWDIGPDEYGN